MTEYVVIYESKGGYTKDHHRLDAASPEAAVEKALETHPTWHLGSLWAVERKHLVRVFIETRVTVTTSAPVEEETSWPGQGSA